MEMPTLVGRRGQASSEQVLFVFAQAADASELCEHLGDFFFHRATLTALAWRVEGQMRAHRPRLQLPARDFSHIL